MRTRRAHAKSRKGCKQCKQRRVKCDEKKPQCGTCKIRCGECVYPTPVTLTWVDGQNGDRKSKRSDVQQESPSSRSNLALLESIKNVCSTAGTLAVDDSNEDLDHESLKLLINWFTSTIHTVTSDEASLRTAQNLISKAAMSHDFLMHGILALSALHLADQGDDAECAKYSTIALRHHNRGLILYQPVLQDINASNSVASVGFSSITTMCSYALSRPENRTKALEPIHELIKIFLLTKGWNEVFQVSAATHQNRPTNIDKPIEENIEIPDTTRAALENLHELNREKGKFDAAHDVNLHSEVIDLLERTFKKLLASKNDPHSHAMWAHELPYKFITLLSEHNTFALLILGHYCAVLHQSGAAWWLRDWGCGLLHTIWHNVDAATKPSLSWAIDSVGLQDLIK